MAHDPLNRQCIGLMKGPVFPVYLLRPRRGRKPMKFAKFSVWVLVGLLALEVAQAQKKPGEAVTVKAVTIKGVVKPGAEVTAVVQFQIEEGFKVQANVPSEPNFIPSVLKLDPAPGLVVSPPKYPLGKEEKVEGLPKPMRVYHGTFEVLLPIRVTPDAQLPAQIAGMLTYQACKGATCFAPRKLKVLIPVAAKAG